MSNQRKTRLRDAFGRFVSKGANKAGAGKQTSKRAGKSKAAPIRMVRRRVNGRIIVQRVPVAD